MGGLGGESSDVQLRVAQSLGEMNVSATAYGFLSQLKGSCFGVDFVFRAFPQ